MSFPTVIWNQRKISKLIKWEMDNIWRVRKIKSPYLLRKQAYSWFCCFSLFSWSSLTCSPVRGAILYRNQKRSKNVFYIQTSITKFLHPRDASYLMFTAIRISIWKWTLFCWQVHHECHMLIKIQHNQYQRQQMSTPKHTQRSFQNMIFDTPTHIFWKYYMSRWMQEYEC